MNKDQARQAMLLGLQVCLEGWPGSEYWRLDEGLLLDQNGHAAPLERIDVEGWRVYHEPGDTFTAEQAEFLLLEAGERIGCRAWSRKSWVEWIDGEAHDEDGRHFPVHGVIDDEDTYTIVPRHPEPQEVITSSRSAVLRQTWPVPAMTYQSSSMVR